MRDQTAASPVSTRSRAGPKLSFRRQVRNVLKAASMQMFVFGDRLGWHIIPKHYYTANHDVHWLRAHPGLWARPIEFSHIHWDIDEQLAWLGRIVSPDLMAEVDGLGVFRELTSQRAGPGFGPIESQVLHCFIRAIKPKRVVEIGAGVSSLCMLNADRLNTAEGSGALSLTCIDPNPWPGLEETTNLKLIREPAQSVDIAIFETLQSGDLLFIDSSHAVKVGSEVPRIYLELIPSLRPGVHIHIHDIYFPYLYPPDVLRSYLAWQEATLLLGLLVDNPRLAVNCSLSALHHARGSNLKQMLPDYAPKRLVDGLDTRSAIGMFPSSIYLETH
jgi:predicted O-methyltransferase YrrM